MFFDSIEWDEGNLDHACRRVSAAEIEQVLDNATSWRRHRRYADRVLFTDRTDGGKLLTVVARYDSGRHLVRPITAWEEKMSEPKLDASDRELAEYYDRTGGAGEWDEPEPVTKPERLEVTLSVRFSPSEIDAIRSRAFEVGLKPTAYIRQCALAAEQTPVDRARIHRFVEALARELDDLRRAAS